jgi:hypothetical protein
MKKLINLLLVVVLLAFGSCLNRQFVEGRAEIVSSSDSTLNDSSLVYGYVYRLDWVGTYHYTENEFEIWLENSELRATNDTIGFYSLKTGPGTVTLKCQGTNNEWQELIVELKNLNLLKNRKTQIDFYIGYTIE